MRTSEPPIKLAFLVLVFVGCSSTGKSTDGGSGDSSRLDLPADVLGKTDTSTAGGAPDGATSLETWGSTTLDAAKDISTGAALDGGVDVGLLDSVAAADAPDASLSPLTMSPAVLDFGTVTVGVTTLTQTITVTAQTSIHVQGVGYSNVGVRFGIDTCYDAFLLAGETCSMEVTLTAEASGQVSGIILIGIFQSNVDYSVPFTALAVSLDVGTTVDGAEMRMDSGADTGPWFDAISDTSLDSCDPLKQDCPAKTMGCYPSSGTGRCLVAGGTGVLGTCLADGDCLPGLACIAVTAGADFGICLSLCDVSSPTSICEVGSVCQALPRFPKTSNVGYCLY